MEFVNYKKEWLEIVAEQEKRLRADVLDAASVFELGTILYKKAESVYKKPAAFRIIMNGQTVFSFLMDGTSLNNEWWMDKKLNTSRTTGVSSIRSLIEVAEGIRPMEPEFENEGSYALCGGCFPWKNAAGKIVGWVEVSGLTHEEDHQLAVDAIAELLNIEIPRVI